MIDSNKSIRTTVIDGILKEIMDESAVVDGAIAEYSIKRAKDGRAKVAMDIGFTEENFDTMLEQ